MGTMRSKEYIQGGKQVWRQIMEKYPNWEDRVQRRHQGRDSNKAKGRENGKTAGRAVFRAVEGEQIEGRALPWKQCQGFSCALAPFKVLGMYSQGHVFAEIRYFNCNWLTPLSPSTLTSPHHWVSYCYCSHEWTFFRSENLSWWYKKWEFGGICQWDLLSLLSIVN